MFVHGKNTFVSLDGTDLSPFTNTSDLGRTADTHDVTTYGPNRKSKEYEGGLRDGTASMGGVYDNSETDGPRAVIEPLVGKKVEFIRQIEGPGEGKPQDKVQVIVTNYVETAPVADMVTWSCDMQCSGDIDTTPQGPGV